MLPLQNTPITLRNPDPFPPEVVQQIKDHAIACYPEESCGVVVDHDGPVYIPCENVATDPLNEWRISAEETRAVLELGEVLAICHSHPDGPSHPSATDQEQQIASGDTWGIVPVFGVDIGDEKVPHAHDIIWWGDKLPIQPLYRRQFVWGVFHCWSLYRDWMFLERGVRLPNFACDWDFVEQGHSIFLDNCERAGLRNLGKLDMCSLQVGDMLVGHVRGSFPNHCGAYLGGDDFLHHPTGGASGNANLLRWWPHIDTVFRYEAAQGASVRGAG